MENLPPEILFRINSIDRSIDQMNRDQLTQFTKEIIRAYYAQQIGYQKLLKHEWRIGE